jgi:transcriptional regulator with XRE-family HTH domain
MLDRTSSNLAANIKQFREARGLTQQELAAVSGVPRPTIANLESGSANPTLSVLVRIASSLQVSIEQLIAAPRTDVQLHLAGRLPTRQRGGATVRRLLPDPIPGMEIGRLELPMGIRLLGTPHSAGTREYLACESGELEVEASGHHLRLSAGDVAAFSGDQRHTYTNRGRKSAVAYSVVVLTPTGI